MRTNVTINYGTHTYDTPWVKSKKHCPQCGGSNVWRSDDGGDYYEGEKHCCPECEYVFTIPRLQRMLLGDDDTSKQLLEQLRAIKEQK